MAAWPPSLVNSFLSWVLPPSSDPMPFAAAPDAAKMNATPAAQLAARPAATERPGSGARAAGRRRSGGRAGPAAAPRRDRGGRTARRPRRPPRPAPRTAAPAPTTAAPSNGRVSSTQPSGDVQVSHDGPLGPASHRSRGAGTRPRARRSKFPARRAGAGGELGGDGGDPVNASPLAPIAAANRTEPETGSRGGQRDGQQRGQTRWPPPRSAGRRSAPPPPHHRGTASSKRPVSSSARCA